MDIPTDVALPPTAVKAEPAAEALARFRRRGRLLFTLLAFWSVILGGVVIALGPTDHPLRLVVVTMIGVAIGLALDVALVFGLAERRPWADRATIVVCGIFLVAGILRLLVRLSSGSLEIPLDAIGAALVLAERPTTLAPDLLGDRRRIGLVAAAALLAAVMPLVANGVASGKILGATPSQVGVVATVDCDAIAADPTAPVLINASWDWTGGEPLAGGTDGVVVKWFATTDADANANVEAGDSTGLFVDGEAEMVPTDAVWNSEGPTSALLDPVEDANGRAFGIDVDDAGLVDGHVAMRLHPVSPDARHGSVQVSASYAHLGLWVVDSGQVGCEW